MTYSTGDSPNLEQYDIPEEERMEAKDTVMTKAERDTLWLQYNDEMEAVSLLREVDNFKNTHLSECWSEKLTKAQAELSFKARDKEVDATIKAALGRGPEHCNQHERFVDECMACHDTCNENIDFNLLDKLKDIEAKGRREVAEFCKENQMPDKPSSEPYPGLVIVSKERWQAKLKEWGIEE